MITMTAGLDYIMLSQALGTVFRCADAESQPIPVELMKVTDNTHDSEPESFSLLFHGPKEPFLPQGTYLLENDEIVLDELVMTPVGRDDCGFHYEICFEPKRGPER